MAGGLAARRGIWFLLYHAHPAPASGKPHINNAAGVATGGTVYMIRLIWRGCA